jgi:hypothetical protein
LERFGAVTRTNTQQVIKCLGRRLSRIPPDNHEFTITQAKLRRATSTVPLIKPQPTKFCPTLPNDP